MVCWYSTPDYPELIPLLYSAIERTEVCTKLRFVTYLHCYMLVSSTKTQRNTHTRSLTKSTFWHAQF